MRRPGKRKAALLVATMAIASVRSAAARRESKLPFMVQNESTSFGSGNAEFREICDCDLDHIVVRCVGFDDCVLTEFPELLPTVEEA